MQVKYKIKLVITFGIIAILMLFIIPFFLTKDVENNRTFGIIYFIIFLSFVGWSNYTGEKIEKMSIEEKRDEKIKELLK
jgi:hypothetical protein